MSLDTCLYASQRSVVLSAGGIVATSQPLAAQAGLAILRAGGSAVDAVATPSQSCGTARRCTV